MLRNWQQHETYQSILLKKLAIYLLTQKSRLEGLSKSISKLFLLNLDNLLQIIKPLYPDLGRPAKNQQGIIRFLVLMLDDQEHSITKWSKKVACDPLLFDICGFDSPNAPSVASYYDLLVRFWLASHKKHLSRKVKLKRFAGKPRKKLKANEKLPTRHPGILKKLVTRALEGRLPDFRPEKILQEFLARCIVDVSLDMGILGSSNALSTAFDGSPYYSGGSHYEVKVCDCVSKGIYNCTCPRRFSDPDAKWRWDSYREQWFFGDTLFNVTAADSHYDLPIFMRIVQASRHDSITTVFALRDIHNLYPNIKFKNFLADGAMDKYPIYDLVNHYGLVPFIPLNERTELKQNVQHPGVLCYDDNDNPICHGGIPYHDCGYSKPKGQKYRCWFAANGQEPPKECRCSESPYGRTIYLKPDDDPRLFPPVSRGSKEFKDVLKRRTTVERTNKRLFIDYKIESGKSQSSKMRFTLATFAAINIHLDAWIKHLKFNIMNILSQVA